MNRHTAAKWTNQQVPQWAQNDPMATRFLGRRAIFRDVFLDTGRSGCPQMTVSERTILDELAQVVDRGSKYASRERGKNFFDSLELPALLQEYITASRPMNKSQAARLIGVSPATLRQVLSGKPLSENILFRLRNSFENALQHPGSSVLGDEPDVYFGDWRNTSPRQIQEAISAVAEKLLFLKKIVEGSNSLSSPDSPIDKIQIAQLVALLEATLAAIKAPYVNASETRGFFKWLTKLVKVGIEKGVEHQVSDAMNHAVVAGNDFLHHLASSPGPSDLGDIIT
jgi:hypothetical protein